MWFWLAREVLTWVEYSTGWPKGSIQSKYSVALAGQGEMISIVEAGHTMGLSMGDNIWENG